MAKESKITESPSTSTGTNPIGLCLRNSKHRSKEKEEGHKEGTEFISTTQLTILVEQKRKNQTNRARKMW